MIKRVYSKCKLKILIDEKITTFDLQLLVQIYKQQVIQMLHQEEKLKCFRCNILPSEFIVLNCYHIICNNCLNNYLALQSSHTIFIVCSCGQKTTVQYPCVQVLKSPERRQISQFSLSQHESPKLAYNNLININHKLKNGQKTINQQETIDQGFSHSNKTKYSKRSKDSSSRLIKEIGCFTKLDTSVKNRSSSKKRNQSSFGLQQIDKQLRFLQLQYQKSISDFQDIVQVKIQQFNQIFRQYKRNIRLWYSQLKSEDVSFKINIAQYSKSRYQLIGKQIDRLQGLIYDFSTKVSFKPSCFSPDHRRLKTQVQLQDYQRIRNLRQDNVDFGLFKRAKSPKFTCPHSQLMIQKHKYIKKRCNMLQYD